MVTMSGAPHYRDKFKPAGASNDTPISTAYIGRFRQGVPKREIAFIQRYARREMTACDYQPEPLAWSVRDQLLFTFVDWPSNWGRLAVWRTRETLQHRFPALIGRKPSTTMVK
jgi:hypothetical protein